MSLCQSIATEKRSIRRLERRWKRTGLVIDGQILRDGVQELRDAIDAAKVSSLNTQIAENTNRVSLYKIVDTFLLKKPTLKLPSYDSVLEFAEIFSQFFTKDISEIRHQLDSQSHHLSPRPEIRPRVSFMVFKEVTTEQIVALMRYCPAKSSARDPIPTGLMRKLADVLAAPIARLTIECLLLGSPSFHNDNCVP
ncbi:hypothetical protein DAPPUDRAFT_263620 [Daphnia pulex]|uniref:Reverse transcriptase domain-containing protein n=1 Tax=Daphnia pulex TaxID=6669 RepID=E9HQ45_DAPPU|nr:hypothetical protein DAPPUDRAFT_263620 [Daphnia pulex]|eukprot:EFX66142.1 hypothetical protein DAPPUDRAFT_263620 [Daphnia pulex]